MVWLVLSITYVFLGAGNALLLWFAFALRRSAALRIGAIVSVVASVPFPIAAHLEISASKSSTAAIGYLFLPVYAAGVGAVGLFVGWSTSTVGHWLCGRIGWTDKPVTTPVQYVAATAIIVVASLSMVYGAARSRLLNNAANANLEEADFSALISRAESRHDDSLLEKLASNQQMPPAELRRVFQIAATRSHSANYRVSVQLAYNRATPADTLDALSKCEENSIRVYVATNPNSTDRTLERLSADRDDLVRTWVTANPHASKSILAKLRSDADPIVRSYADTHWRHRRFDAPTK